MASEALVLDRQVTRLFGRASPSTAWSLTGNLPSRVPSTVTKNFPIERNFTVPDKDVLQLEQLLDQARRQIENLTASMFEVDVPEVFDLRPLSSQPITVRVTKIQPALFYFVTDDDLFADDDED